MSSKAKASCILFLIMLVMASACTKPPVPQAVPTLAILPSATPSTTPSSTPSPIPSYTPTPTYTPTYTLTPTPTATATTKPSLTPSQTFTASLTNTLTPTYTFTPTPTYTPTFTYTPTPTYTFTPSATFTLTPSHTPTLTPSFTPSPTLTPVPPQIVSFGVSSTSVIPYTSIRIVWVTNADNVRLEELNGQSGMLQRLQVLPTGQFNIFVPGNLGKVIYFRLVASRNNVEINQTIPVNVVCQYTWFFGSQYVPPNSGCPARVVTSDGRYQSFERGVMLYVSGSGLNRIYGLQDDGSLYVSAVSGWDGATLNTSPAPDGRFMPQEMFNWVYYNTLAPIGSWNSALGWATGNVVSAPRSIQWENAVSGSNPFYIDAPDGAVYRFSGGDSGTWRRVR